MPLKALSLALLAFTLTTTAFATEVPPTNIISFNTEVEKNIERDVLSVRLFYQTEGKNLSELNKAISERLNKAIGMVKAQSAVEIKGNSRNTSVRYNDEGKKTGWVARAELELESKDFQALSNAITELDGLFAVEEVNATLSPEKLAGVENELTQEALEKFKKKATLIQNSLQMNNYRLLNLEISSVNEQIPLNAYRALGSAKVGMLSAEGATADNAFLENGKEAVRVRANARIELFKD